MANSDWKYVQRNKTTGQYRTTEEGGGGGGGGASALSDLEDVNISSASDGQILKYDSQSNEWINANEGSPDADDVSYDNTTSGMTATNIQDAIDEIAQDFQDGCDTISQAVIAKGQTPASNSPSDIAYAISQIQTGGSGGQIVEKFTALLGKKETALTESIMVTIVT